MDYQLRIDEKQQLINALSFDLNTYFISNKDLSIRVREILKQCNELVERGSSINPFSSLCEEYVNHGLPVIREVLSHGYLVNNLDSWKKGLQAKDGIVDLLVTEFDKSENSRTWILRELSRYSNSHFESITFFIQVFFVKISMKKNLLKSVLAVDGANDELKEKSFVCLTFIVSKVTGFKLYGDNYEDWFPEGQLTRNWPQFYVNFLSKEELEVEKGRVARNLVDFILKDTSITMLKRLIPILKLGGPLVTEQLFTEFERIGVRNASLWATDFSKPFLSWCHPKPELPARLIPFIKGAIWSDINATVKCNMVRAFANKKIYGYKPKSDKAKYAVRYQYSPSRQKKVLKDFLTDNLEPDVRKVINQYLVKEKRKPIGGRIDKTFFPSLISNLKNDEFDVLFDTLNESTNVMEFLSFVVANDNEEIQQKLTVLLSKDWK